MKQYVGHLKKRIKTASAQVLVHTTKKSADFVAHMEDILELYCLSYNQPVPLVYMDEQPTQLIKETRIPIPAEPGKVVKYHEHA